MSGGTSQCAALWARSGMPVLKVLLLAVPSSTLLPVSFKIGSSYLCKYLSLPVAAIDLASS